MSIYTVTSTKSIQGVSAGGGQYLALTVNEQLSTYYGFNAGMANKGKRNTFTGYMCGTSNVDGANSTFVGHMAGALNINGSGNVALGSGAGYNITSHNNIAIGFGTDTTLSGTKRTIGNIAIGTGSVFEGANSIVLGNNVNNSTNGSIVIGNNISRSFYYLECLMLLPFQIPRTMQ